jgi:hypothetical protein
MDFLEFKEQQPKGLSSYDRTMLARAIRAKNGVHQRTVRVCRPNVALTQIAGCAVLLGGTFPAQAQQLGQKQTTTTGHIVTVYSISWPTPVSSVSADVEVCAAAKAPANGFAFPSFFQVHFADGGAIGAYGSKKQPTLERTPLKAGQCVRGWLDFAVTSGQKPTVIRYHEMGSDNKVIEWPVK